MDINGARELAQRFGPRARPQREPFPSTAVSETALPVFHWLGIDQPNGQRTEPEHAAEPSRSAGVRRSGRFSLRRA
jgi:hypothetical protein